MNVSRLAYRARQFWNALLRPERQVASAELLPFLNPAQLILFRRMQPSEQAHAFSVFSQLKAAGENDPDLLVAALLHDVGKILAPLSVIDRVIIVVGQRMFPRLSRRWGQGLARGWKRPFVVAECHPAWGADLVQQTGAAAATVELVRAHQEALLVAPRSRVEKLLVKLQEVDDQN